ncbi:MAG: class I SAM-dependent methyltransferase [bacterium]
MELLTSTDWTNYELIDTGDREKLERFGDYILIRPEPQAVWKKALSAKEWDNLANARFARGKSSSHQSKVSGSQFPVTSHQSLVTSHDSRFTIHDSRKSGSQEIRKEERGEWIKKPGMPDQWMIGYTYKEMSLKFRLGLTAFGHIGVFPEQAENWKFIYDIAHPASRILNLFAYTGGSSLAARAAGADVVHVDSVKPVITWAREDMEASGLEGIRWVVEDALKFVQREVKRGNRYDGIILDPPAYGRGPDGEKWVLEESVDEILALCAQLLNPEKGFLVLSFYSMGFSSLIGENLVNTHFGDSRQIQSGELYFSDRAERKLPLGTFSRFC